MTTAPNTQGPRPQRTANERLRDPDQVKRDARAVSYEWELGKDEDGGTRLVVLSVSHHKRSRGGAFVSSLCNMTVKEMGFMTERSFSPLSATRISVEAVARFSSKRLDEFAASALQRVRDLYEQGDPQVHGYFQEQA